VDWESFEDVFKRRAEGEDIKVARDLQRNYQHPVTDVQKRTAGYIAAYLKSKKAEWENVVLYSAGALATAQESLAKKGTKKAREDIRIGTNKSQIVPMGACSMRSLRTLTTSQRIST
jgi:hypothetical protein